MARISIEAHCADAQFEEDIRKDYGVEIVRREHEPWAVVFEGTRAGLVAMLLEHWGTDERSREDYERMIVG